MSGVLQEGQRGCWRILTIQAISILIVLLLGCGLILIPFWLVNRFELSIWWLIIPAGLFLIILIGGGIGWMAYTLYRQARQLDAAAAPMDLTGVPYQLFYRQYHGKVGGRDIAMYFYRGPTVEIDIPVAVQTRLGISERRAELLPLAGLLNRKPLALADPALADLAVFSLDENWAGEFLRQPGVTGLLQQLIQFEGAFTSRQVLLRPGWLRLRLFGSRNWLDFTFDVGPEQMQGWLDALLALSQTAESISAPQATDDESSMEQAARAFRSQNPNRIIAITAGLVIAMLCCFGVIGIAAFLWAMAQ